MRVFLNDKEIRRVLVGLGLYDEALTSLSTMNLINDSLVANERERIFAIRLKLRKGKS